MCGGGGFFGAVLNIVSLTPMGAPLRPFVIAYNMINAVSNNNPLGMLTSGFSAYNFMNPSMDVGTTEFGDGLVEQLGEGSYGANPVSYMPDPFSDEMINVADASFDPSVNSMITPDWQGIDTVTGPSLKGMEAYDAFNTGGKTFDDLNFLEGMSQEQFDTNLKPMAGVATEATRDLGFANGGNFAGALEDTMSKVGGEFNGLSATGLDDYLGNMRSGIAERFPRWTTEYRTVQDMGQGIGEMQSAANQLSQAGGLSGLTSGGSMSNEMATRDMWSSLIPDGTKALGPASSDITGQMDQVTGTGLDQYGYPSNVGTTSIDGIDGVNAEPTYPQYGGSQDDIPGLERLGINTGTTVPQQPQGGNEMNFSLKDLFKQFQPKPMGMAELGLRGLGALDSYNKNNEAMDMMKNMQNQVVNWQDPNRARGDFANQEWQKTMSNPMYGYDQFMAGPGREFTDQARAQAARSGRRGGYLNSGRMQSDLASLWAKNQIQRAQAATGGFAQGQNNMAAAAQMTPALASMMRNQNAPVYNVLGELGTRGLKDVFEGSYGG
jgi:hypothetical protein